MHHIAITAAAALATLSSHVSGYADFADDDDISPTLSKAMKAKPGPYFIVSENKDTGPMTAYIQHVWVTDKQAQDFLVIEWEYGHDHHDPMTFDIAPHPFEKSWFSLHESKPRGENPDHSQVGPTIRLTRAPDMSFIDGFLDVVPMLLAYPSEYLYREFADDDQFYYKPKFPTQWWQTDEDLNLRTVEGGYRHQAFEMGYLEDAQGAAWQPLASYGAAGGSPLGSKFSYTELKLVQKFT